MSKKDQDNQDLDQQEPSRDTELEQKVAELTEDLIRSQADFANFRRRSEEEKAQLSNFAKINAVTKLLPLIDNIERALKHTPDEIKDNQWVKGVVQLDKQFKKALSDIGVEKIEATGQSFDPNLHEAVSYDDDGEGEEIVIEELQAGYKIGDDVIRHSMVRVGKNE